MEEEKIIEEEKKKVKVIKITEIRAGESIFASHGYSRVKVTKGDEIICYEIPIQSTGISDLIDSFQRKAPTPPVTKTLVEPDSEHGKQMGIVKNTWMKIPDFADPDYIQAVEEHNTRIGNAILLRGLAIELKNESGNTVIDEDEKIEIFKKMGMSTDHFQQIIDDIQNLTRWSDEERADFLG